LKINRPITVNSANLAAPDGVEMFTVTSP
jgi:hypothetical protein